MGYKIRKKDVFDLCRYFYILVYLWISNLNIFICNKPVFISHHAMLRAELREIAFPDQVTRCICTGKMYRFGKGHIRFVKKNKKRMHNLYWN